MAFHVLRGDTRAARFGRLRIITLSLLGLEIALVLTYLIYMVVLYHTLTQLGMWIVLGELALGVFLLALDAFVTEVKKREDDPDHVYVPERLLCWLTQGLCDFAFQLLLVHCVVT